MLFQTGQNWVLDFFVSRGWLAKRRQMRRRQSNWNLPSSVPAECLEDRTLLSTITVTSLADSLNAGSGVTLRDAIQAANTDTSVDGSTAGVAGVQNVIAFQSGLTGTISLDSTLGQMTISSSMKVTGLGAANTIIDAQQNSRIFNITSNAGDVTLDALTLENGKTTSSYDSGHGNYTPGGGIAAFTSGTLTITNSVLSGNSTAGFRDHGGAIYSRNGKLVVTGSTLSGNSTAAASSYGGAIYSQTSVTITNSTLTGNATHGSGSFGGAIAVGSLGGATTVTNSTISNNSSSDNGGGFENVGNGVVTITSSTIANNSAGNHGGGILNLGSMTIANSTLSGNSAVRGGGLFNLGLATVTNSTIAGNSAGGGGGVYIQGTYTSGQGETDGPMTFTNSTVAGNFAPIGGGIVAVNPAPGGTLVTLFGTIVAGNAISLANSTPSDWSGPVANPTSAYNLIGNGTNIGLNFIFTAAINGPGTDDEIAFGANNSLVTVQFFGGINNVRQISTNGNAISVDLATDSHGAVLPSETANSIAAALNSNPLTRPLLTAFAGALVEGTGNGVLAPAAQTAIDSLATNGLTHNIFGRLGAPLNPLLGPLANNGGPTQTMALLAGSPAIDAGAAFNDPSTGNTITSDQRGIARPFGAAPDIGAFESQVATPTINTLLTNGNRPVLTGTYDQLNASVLQVTVKSTTYTLGTNSQLTSDGAGHWTLNLSSAAPFADGVYAVAVHTADSAGHSGDTNASNALTIDTTPPATPTVKFLATNNPTPTLTGTWDAGTSGGAVFLQVTVNSTTYTLGTDPQLTPSGTSWTLNLAGTTALPDGTYAVLVHTADAAGNVANSTTSNQLVVNTAAPPTTAFAGEYAVATQGSNVLSLASITQSITQNGPVLNLVGSLSVSATVTSTTQLSVGGVIGTYGDSVITFGATGSFANQVWTKLDLPANFTNQGGAAVQIIQSGPALTFVNKLGQTSAGHWISPTQFMATDWGNEIGTLGNGIISWSVGVVWSENLALTGTQNGTGTTSITATPSPIYVSDYLNPSGLAVHLVQTGTNNVVIIDATGHMSQGTFINSTQFSTPFFPGQIATISGLGDTITWSGGIVWTQTARTSAITLTDYTNQFGVPVHLIQNGTSQLAFVDALGRTALGSLNGTTVQNPIFAAGVTGTLSGNTIVWSNQYVWTQTNVVPLLIALTDTNGSVSHAQLTSATTLVGLDGTIIGLTAIRLNGKLFWSNGQVWDNFDPDALNALFEMATGYP